MHTRAALLLEVFQAVPRLIELIDTEDKLAQLQAINRSFRSWVHWKVRQITIGSPDGIRHLHGPELSAEVDHDPPRFIADMVVKNYIENVITEAVTFSVEATQTATLVTGFWPLLSKIRLEGDVIRGAAIDMLQHGHLPSLTALDLSTCTFEANCLHKVVGVLPKLTELTLSGVCCHVTELLQADWSQLQHLEMCHMELHGRVWPLSRQPWPYLSVLSLHHSDLEADDLQDIVFGSWPKLTKLCLTHNKIGANLLHEIFQADFSCLEELDLSDAVEMKLTGPSWTAALQSYVQPTAVSLLSLKHLKLAYTCLDGRLMSALQQVHCPCLETFIAHDELGMNPAVLYQFVKWPLLSMQKLDLSGCSIDLAGIKQLVTGNWPCLLEVWLIACDLKVQSVSWLFSCSYSFWPRLQCLDLRFNLLGIEELTIELDNCHTLPLKLLVCHEIPLWLRNYWPHIQTVNLGIM